MYGSFMERQPVLSVGDVSGNAGIRRRMADRIWEDGGSGSAMYALYIGDSISPIQIPGRALLR